ncbi:endonuclease/exonuclease/phosphatase family protein [Hymenobacter jeollabukensis]|uniref:Endonuclease n=1 Tax=Hymenobacter jeollabukensis TaxID=2025313 RepID=A0A5R8WKJ7_9BACT|nr:endonuclease/exonuclease/phosphatase family protein [Hymenobacter jeollabukensis]TLM89458.1 endonuclease [Hymenobacter jeollabukensis]
MQTLLFVSLAQLLTGLVVVLGVAGLLATLLPLIRATAWWIRVFDFPRLQIVGVMAVVLPGALLLDFWHWQTYPWLGRGLVLALGAAIVYQLARILPYTPIVRKQVGDSAAAGSRGHVSLLMMNVLQYNQQAARALQVIREADPDIIMAVETDPWWLDQLRPLQQTHPYTCHEPLDNTYGLLFFSRLPLIGCRIKYLLDDDVPSIHTRVQMPDGTRLRVYGLHPKPPAPQEAKTSTKRDAELLLVGKEIDRKDEPTIVFGDMNDVAWSHTSELFRRISGLMDPRVGRGLLPTFHADYRLLRWPLDHVFVSPHFKVDDMQRLPYVGSDHFPIYIKLSYEPHDKHEQEANLEEADESDHIEALEKIKDGFQEEVTEEREEAKAEPVRNVTRVRPNRSQWL